MEEANLSLYKSSAHNNAPFLLHSGQRHSVAEVVLDHCNCSSTQLMQLKVTHETQHNLRNSSLHMQINTTHATEPNSCKSMLPKKQNQRKETCQGQTISYISLLQCILEMIMMMGWIYGVAISTSLLSTHGNGPRPHVNVKQRRERERRGK